MEQNSAKNVSNDLPCEETSIDADFICCSIYAEISDDEAEDQPDKKKPRL